jgi:predicted alpha/beta hydrolase
MAVKVMVAPAITARLEAAPARKLRDPLAPPKPRRRKSAVYDADGHEVLITLMCLKCHQMRPLAMFGLRRMADGSIRNQPWCRGCRSGAGADKPRRREQEEVVADVDVASTSESVAEAAPVAPQRPMDAGLMSQQIAAALAAGWRK